MTKDKNGKPKDEIKELIDTRRRTYGSVLQTSHRYSIIRSIMNPGGVVPATPVERYCLDAIAMKLARLIGNPRDRDTIKDIQGYCHLMLYGDDPPGESTEGIVREDQS